MKGKFWFAAAGINIANTVWALTHSAPIFSAVFAFFVALFLCIGLLEAKKR